MRIFTLLGNFIHLEPHLMSHVANDSKDDKSGKETCGTVSDGHYDRVSVTRIGGKVRKLYIMMFEMHR